MDTSSRKWDMIIPSNLKQYERERGFYYDYDKVTPGPKAMN